MLLMEEAEKIALEEHGSRKIAVISGRHLISLVNLILCTVLMQEYGDSFISI